MSRFTAPLVVTPTEDYRSWIVLSSAGPGTPRFGYDIGKEGSGLTIHIPPAFETDFASIPWFARWLIPTWGRHTNAAVIHDYLYRGGTIRSDEDTPSPIIVLSDMIWPKIKITLPYPTRRVADVIMLEAMKVLEVPKWQRRMIYWGVRLGGWASWRKNRDEEEK